jgi:hypothetical protein
MLFPTICVTVIEAIFKEDFPTAGNSLRDSEKREEQDYEDCYKPLAHLLIKW